MRPPLNCVTFFCLLPDRAEPVPFVSLARKAESARQARLRHKQFVTDLQEQAERLQARITELEAFCTTGPAAAPVALGELKAALKPDQLQQLIQWLVEAQGENHVLARYENGAAAPPTAGRFEPVVGPAARSMASAPIEIGGTAGHWRGGAGVSASPMESDDDSGAFPLSRCAVILVPLFGPRAFPMLPTTLIVHRGAAQVVG